MLQKNRGMKHKGIVQEISEIILLRRRNFLLGPSLPFFLRSFLSSHFHSVILGPIMVNRHGKSFKRIISNLWQGRDILFIFKCQMRVMN